MRGYYLSAEGAPRGPVRAPSMATLADESYLYPAYSLYPYRYGGGPKGKGGPGPWRQRGCYFPGYGGGASTTAAVAAAAAAEYFDNYQRAQLKAILAQVNPHLTPRLRKANTREAAVQVNPRQDAAVQCSLGPRPLQLLSRRPLPPRGEQEQGSPASGSAWPVRFPRTVAVYSPVASRCLTTTLLADEPPPQQQQQRDKEAEAAAEAVRASWEKPDGEPQAAREDEEVEAQAPGPKEGEGGAKPQEQQEQAVTPQPLPPPLHRADYGQSKGRVRFQVRSGAA